MVKTRYDQNSVRHERSGLPEAGDMASPGSEEAAGSDNPEVVMPSLRRAARLAMSDVPLEVKRSYQAQRIISLDRAQKEISAAVLRLRQSGVEPYVGLNDASRNGLSTLAPGRVEVWYVKGSALDREAITVEGARAVHPDLLHMTHVRLGRVASEDCDQIRSVLQGDVWSPVGEAGPLIASKGLLHTSMSDGDAVRYPDGQILVADRHGFAAPSLPAPPWLARVHDAMDGLLRHGYTGNGDFISSMELAGRLKTSQACDEANGWSAEGFNLQSSVLAHLVALRNSYQVQVGLAEDGRVGYRLRAQDEVFNLTAYDISPRPGGTEAFKALGSTRVTVGAVAKELERLRESLGLGATPSPQTGQRIVILPEETNAVGGFAVAQPPEWN